MLIFEQVVGFGLVILPHVQSLDLWAPQSDKRKVISEFQWAKKPDTDLFVGFLLRFFFLFLIFPSARKRLRFFHIAFKEFNQICKTV